jgi:CubicO group peptidase (beta-lactamase class C family)
MRTHARSILLPGMTAALALALLLPVASPARDRADLDGLEGHVVRVLEELDVPGMAIAVVKDGDVVLSRGYGVRRVGEPDPVRDDTRFGIASNSKAFTTAALSILVEEGKIAWDDPVTRHVPEFQMHDPWVTREITVRDLVTHRSGLGLGAGDLMWWPPTDLTREEIIRGVRHLKPASSFRSTYAYNNIMFIVAGEVVARASGRPWGEFVRERILVPLGMERSTTSAAALEPGDGVATPHVHVGGRAEPIRLMSFANAAGAVGVNATAADMARWLRMLLECREKNGVREGQECVLTPGAIQQMWSSQTVVTPSPLPEGLESLASDFSAYGLGFRLREYRGHKVVGHGGSVPGYFSSVTLVPDERLGVAVLSNQESSPALSAVTQHILDTFLGTPEPAVDWLDAFVELAAVGAQKAEEKVARDLAARDLETSPSLAPPGYVGAYRDPWYGEVRIVEENGRLVLDMTRTPRMLANLEHWQHDTFVARWRETWMSDHAPYDVFVTFALGPAGTVEQMTMTPVSPAIDFSFDFQDLALTPVKAATKVPAED